MIQAAQGSAEGWEGWYYLGGGAVVLGFLSLALLMLLIFRWPAEESAEEKVDALLRRALDLENTLKYNRYGESEKKLRREALALIFEAKTTVEDCLPAFRDDLSIAPAEGSGMTQLLNAVEDCYRVLAAVRSSSRECRR
ncbi:MAG TPA: hypothetical protein VIS51_00340 [Solirubrobacterales bacterium]